ncbi:MAG TPA: bifunctional 4-hydroxy-2-oxoglutarate aldolase/2-dehydro-3-deoxy-phosphogluconate aldolase [Rhodanobacteraceae bacterium]
MTDQASRQLTLESILQLAPVVPVVVVHELAHAVPLARALVAGGTPAIEITLRTPVALDAIRAIANEVPGARVGAGTVLTPQQLHDAARAGASFAVSPGSTRALLDAADDTAIPLLPGAATASEVMTLLERGYTLQKCFPAAAVGGVDLLRSWASPLPDARFCPTGGVRTGNAHDYLALPNVVCVGGSWLTPRDALTAGDWSAVEALARAAAGLR